MREGILDRRQKTVSHENFLQTVTDTQNYFASKSEDWKGL